MSSVKDVMRHDKLVTATPGERVIDAVRKMYENNVGSVLVVSREGRLVGIFTERDLVKVVAEGVPLDTRLDKVMSRDLIVARGDEPIALAGSKMIERWIRHMPVVDSEGRPVGIISIRDVLRSLLSSSTFP